MRPRTLLLTSLFLVFLPTSSPAQIIDPSRSIDWSRAGIAGPVPNRATVCATLNPGATSAQINSAIAACPGGQVVFLNAGTYTLSAGIDFNAKSNVTLRGAGPDRTFLVFTGGASCGGLGGNVCLRNAALNHVENPVNTASWTAGYAKGATSITLSSTTNLRVGSQVILDQLDDSADAGGVFVCQAAGACATEGPGGTGRAGRVQEQIVKVTAISGSTVTISPGLHMPNWRSSQAPGAWWSSANPIAMSGIEDLSLTHTGSSATAGIYVYNARNCWIKNVKSVNANRNHVWLYQSAGIVVRDSYFYGTKSAASQSYGVESYMTSDNLVENNIFQHITAPMMIGGSTAGSVFAYNYSTDDFYFVSGWLIPSSVLHAGGTGMVLFEGNDGSGLLADAIHGTSQFVTAFRNVWLGWEPGKSQQTVPVHLYAFHRFFNIIGNVLGRAGTHSRYEDAAPSGTNANSSIYVLGWSDNEGSTFAGVPNDTLVKSTLMRWGNYDVATGTARFQAGEVPAGLSQFRNPVPASTALPASLYATAKPAWFGAVSWPPIGGDVTGGQDPTGHAFKIPARLCFESTARNPDTTLVFNAERCYAAGSTARPNAPSNLRVR